MKKVIFIIILLVVVIGLFLHYGRKSNLNPDIGFQDKKSQSPVAESLQKTREAIPINLSDFQIPYEGKQLVQYLLPKVPNGDEVITHLGYTLAYNEQNEEADWVAYELEVTELNIYRKRSDNFRPDPDVTTHSATPADYFHSGYDRGHLAPAADMKWSAQAMNESFYMSNMTPQEPDFNRGIWEDLEEQVRNWAIAYNDIYVVTGPVFEEAASERRYIGTNKVAVPDAFFKIILDCSKNNLKTIAFLITNEGSMQSYWQYTTTIDQIEKITGLDFFPSLPDSVENMIERSNHSNLWK
jgi:endonuclease G, mitochondrial